MGKTYIPLTEQNQKLIKNFIGLCRMNGIEGDGEPSFTFKEKRAGIGTITFDIFFRCNGVQEASWNMTVRTDTPMKLHDPEKTKAGELYCYLDSYFVKQGSLTLEHKTSKFNVFSF